jgi:hypothetical protein
MQLCINVKWSCHVLLDCRRVLLVLTIVCAIELQRQFLGVPGALARVVCLSHGRYHTLSDEGRLAHNAVHLWCCAGKDAPSRD